jgi:serine/threonine protein phosphatase PrpC
VSPAPRIEAASQSDVGLVREKNEDAWGEGAWDEGRGRWFTVADGMGGHAGGATASRLAVEAIRDHFANGGRASEARVREALAAANRRVYGESRRDPRLAGMGTTAVLLVFDAGRAWVGNVGDSRVYRLRDDAIRPLTRDHSLVAEMVRRGVLSEAQAAQHPRRNELLRSLGTLPDVEIDVEAVHVAGGDVFLLCSDGLHGVVDDAAIAAFLRDPEPEDAALALVEAAIGQGAPDNVTVQVVRIDDPGE